MLGPLTNMIVFKAAVRIGIGVMIGGLPMRAEARDQLPLKRGVYVRADVPCSGASNAYTLAYSGGENGINDQQDFCKIKSLKSRKSTYTLVQACENMRDNSRSVSTWVVVVQSPTSFVLDRVTYRYCRSIS